MVQENVAAVDAEALAMMSSPQSQQGAEFGSVGAPQWKSLHQPGQTAGFQETVVTGAVESSDAVSSEAVSPYAFYTDETEAGQGPSGGSEWDAVAVPAAEAPEEPYLAPVNEATGRVPAPDRVLPMEQSGSSSRTGKILMAALIVVVVLLIVAVVIWLVVSGRFSASAMSATVETGQWIRQLV